MVSATAHFPRVLLQAHSFVTQLGHWELYLGYARLDDRFEDLECVGGSVRFTLFKILFRLSHCIRNVCEAEHLCAGGTRERVEGSSLHLNREHTFRSRRFDRLGSFAEWRIRSPARADDD